MIKTVAVIGAGAVGSFFLGGMKDTKDLDMWVVASGSRKERLEQEGIELNGKPFPLQVKTPEASAGADLVIICVKYGALRGILEDLKVIADDHTIILCPMNGVDSEEILAEQMGKRHIVHSMMVIAAERSGNRIWYNEGTIPCVHFGRAPGYGEDPDVLQIRELFERSGLEHRCRDNIIEIMWNKYALNISTNIAQAIIGCSYGAYKTSPYMFRLGQGLLNELLAIAKAKNIDCTFDFRRALEHNRTNDVSRFSTLQDLTEKRHTEVDMFCGTLIRLGKEYGIPTPFNEFAWLAIKALEEKNDGKIS